MTSRFDVIVVGVGTMGSSACYHLARRGARVLGLDRFAVPHGLGSHHGFSRMIRLAYFEHPDYVVLLKRAYELWRQLEADCGQQLLHMTGGLYLGRPESDLVSGSIRAARDHGLAHEVLDRAQLAERYPQFTPRDDMIGFFEPQAGFLRPEAVVAAQALAAMRQGAELHGHEPVKSWDAGGRATRESGKPRATPVTVQTEKAQYHADQLVFCGGPWSSQLVGDLGAPLTVTRQVMAWTWPRHPDLFASGRLPVWALDPADRGNYRGIYYGFPMMADNPGFKIACHWPAQVCDPDRVERGPLPADEGDLRAAVRRYLPDADGPLLSLRVCLYTNSPDAHFIIDTHPRHRRVTIACAFSGHGFKFASVVGEVLADLALEGRSDLPIDFLRLSRFG